MEDIKYVNTTKEEFLSKKLLFKYMPLEFALGTIKEKYLWLCNPIIWKDPFEKWFIEAKYQVNNKEEDFPLKCKLFCSCITQTRTSEAHWNNYSKGQIGISFIINREELVKVLETHTKQYDVYIGKVKYIKTNDFKKKISKIPGIGTIQPVILSNHELLIKLLLLKRIAFTYEDEIRIIVVKKNKTKENGIKLPYTIQPSDLIEGITIDPNVGENVEVMLKDLFKNQYGFSKVYKSQLYSMPNNIKIEL